MKRVTILLVLSFMSSIYAYSSDTTSSVIFKPLRLRTSSNMLEGSIYAEGLIYETPCPNIKNPSKKISEIDIDWKKMLNSGISSLLFEYKNYPTIKELSSYSIFANGNYNVIDDQSLSVLNSIVLGNQFLLKEIYNWMSPYYKEAFSLLTVEEQDVIWNNLRVAEAFINYTIENRQEKKYRSFLKTHHLTEDPKITGFLNRRINKKQWTIEDCKYWISIIKKDIQTFKKRTTDPSAHYQITDTVTKNLFVVSNSNGDFTIVNNKFKAVINKKYKLICKIGNSLYAYQSSEYNDFIVYPISNFNYFTRPMSKKGIKK